MPTPPAPTASPAYLTYEQFGRAFFEHAVTPERISGVLEGVTGDDILFGPLGVGPGRLVKANAKVAIGEAELHRNRGTVINYALRIPVDIALRLNFAVDTIHYAVTGDIHMALHARAQPPLKIAIEIVSPSPSDVSLHIVPGSLPASAIKRVGGVEREMKKVISGYVANEIRKPEITAACMIDVAQQMDSVWP